MNNPLPQSLASECRKAAKIISKFIDPECAEGIDAVIPKEILQKAKGFAIFSVVKAGFIWSGRIGSGLVVSKKADGSWSAPSAIGTGGVGFGGQIGAQLTDFVIILNTESAVKAFSEGGNFTLGGNLSVAAGPLGRSAEVSGTIAHLAAIYSYSKSKGLFAGVSLEGSGIYERKDANELFYKKKVRAKELLKGNIEAPKEANILFEALDKRINNMHSRTPSYHDNLTHHSVHSANSALTSDKPASYGRRIPPPIPPKVNKKVIALYDYEAQEPGDLSIKKGDLIIVTKKTDNNNDWWEGIINGQSGTFPANYVEDYK